MSYVARALVCLIASSLLTAEPASAQTPSIPPPATYNPVDANGVNVATGSFNFSTTPISIGQPGQGGLTYYATYDASDDWRHNVSGMIVRTPIIPPPPGEFPLFTVVVMGQSYTFTQLLNGDFEAQEDPSVTLVDTGSGYEVTLADGSVAHFGAGTYAPFVANEGLMTSLERPDGEVLSFTYTSILMDGGPFYARRLQSVTNNLGYQLHFRYLSNSWSNDWFQLVEVTALNNGVDYCDPTANACTFTRDWPSLTFDYGSGQFSVTDSLGRETILFETGGRVTGIRYPASTSGQNVIYGYNLDRVALVSYDGGATEWEYEYSPRPNPPIPAEYDITTTITNPLGDQTIVTTRSWDPLNGTTNRIERVVSVENVELDETIQYQYGSYNYWQIERITQPLGDYVQYARDGRGNVLSRRQHLAGGGAYLEVEATYPTTCANPVTCNQPETIEDARGSVWTFEYNATHGGVTEITGPAVAVPGVGNVQPQTRYAYTDFAAWYRNSTGSIVPSSTPVWRRVSASQCSTSASCAGQATEVVTETTYYGGSSSVATNVLPEDVTTRSGDGLLSAVIRTEWTPNGDAALVNGPRTDVLDIVRYRYDDMRQRVGEIQSAVTVGSSTLRPAVRTDYDENGQIVDVARGTVPETLNTSVWDQDFDVLEHTESAYDTQRRKVRDIAFIGAVAQRLTQYSYDAANRLECTAVRMNPDQFDPSELPPSACTLEAPSSYGPDRITRFEYDAAGRVLTEWRAWGVTEANNYPETQQQYARYTYNPNGWRLSVRDANNNRSAYVYDGYGRLCRLYFPIATSVGANQANTGGISEGSLTCSSGGTNPDYEGYSYDNNGNRIGLRLRSSETISYTYDALNRETLKDLPGSSSTDVYSGYDLLGRRLYARFASASGNGIVYTYDALSHVKTEAETWNNRTVKYDYDEAGNRLRVYYPDDDPNGARRYIRYTYDVLNRMDQVRENNDSTGVELLGDYTYDFLSRPTLLAFGNGTSTAIEYAAGTQNWSYAQNFPNDAARTLDVDFTRNAAAQTLTRNLSNALYDYDAPALNQSYNANGLNQYISVGGVTFSYSGGDGQRGNLTSDGARTFDYDLENRLLSVSGSASMTLNYDPLGRLRETIGGGTTTTFLYAGDQLVAEYNAATMLRRYAYGAGVDRPITWYEGTGFGTRRRFHADELGSIIATSNSSGAATIYSYGPYGEPDATNGWAGSRFRYTGQITLPQAQLYHYKARVYDPLLGRFLQTDPVGYEDDLNVYAYVGNDPLSGTDPTGTVVETLWDAANVALGAASLARNIGEGDWAGAAVDGVGLTYDAVATTVPFLPAGASAAITASRAGNGVADALTVGADVATTARAADRAARNAPTTGGAARIGRQVHSETADAVEGQLSQGANSFLRGANRSTGRQPDLRWDNATGVWADVTTRGQWARHTRDYGPIGEGVAIFYERGRGVVDTLRLRSGAGATIALLSTASGRCDPTGCR